MPFSILKEVSMSNEFPYPPFNGPMDQFHVIGPYLTLEGEQPWSGYWGTYKVLKQRRPAMPSITDIDGNPTAPLASER
jgi:hypothetical protein